MREMTPKDIRKARGKLKRGQFANLLGTTDLTIWRWELGKSNPEGPATRLLELVLNHRKETLSKLTQLSNSDLEKRLF